MFINRGEIIPMSICDGQLIILVKVDRILGFDAQLALQTYGVIEDAEDVTIVCKKSKASAQSINL
jgi:hypothetical protein